MERQRARDVLRDYLDGESFYRFLESMANAQRAATKEVVMGERDEAKGSRWSEFSDEELIELRNGALERHQILALPFAVRARAGRLASELRKEVRYRESERTSYRGPGLYRRWDGFTESVLGVAVHETDLGRRMLVVLRRPDDASPSAHFTAVSIEFFDGREDDGSRRFTHVEVEGS